MVFDKFDHDPEVPYWRSNIDAEALYRVYAQTGAVAVDALVDAGLLDPDVTPEFGPFAVMEGRFLPLLTNTQTYFNTFTPGAGNERAIVVPILQDRSVVDICAVSADDVAVWGCVTGKGTIVGTPETSQIIRVYEAPWRWFLFGCDGIVVLAESAYATGIVDQNIHASTRGPLMKWSSLSPRIPLAAKHGSQWH